MRLLQRHPGIALRDCGHCQKYQYDENTGLPVETAKGSGQYYLRYGPLLCRTTGCPKGAPEAPQSLNDRNMRAYQHYRECRAVGSFPDDPVVRRNAAIIRDLEDLYDRELMLKLPRL